MWIIAFLGMATIYAEAVLAQKTRVVNEDGSVAGGPVQYIKKAFPNKFGSFLAGFFAVACVIALGFIGAMVQSNSIGEAISNATGGFIKPWMVGLVLVALCAVIFIGGVSRIASVSEKIVPVMAVLYILGGLIVIFARITFIPQAFGLIFKYAFVPQALIGGSVGMAIKTAISQGAKRGLFSNEAGMGSTPHAHAQANVKNAHTQGTVAIAGVFIDTFIVLTFTALIVISTLYTSDNAGAWQTLNKSELVANGFLVEQAGKRYTTYVCFNPETYSLELEDKCLQKKMELAKLLVREYVPQIRAAIEDVKDIYIPSGNRELFEAAAIFYAVNNKCNLGSKFNFSQYSIKTLAGGNFIAYVYIPATQSDPDYVPSQTFPPYWACGDMVRWSEKYPSIYAWSFDTRYSSRTGAWKNNLTSDYEYLYEFMTGAIENTPANKEKFDRLKARGYLTEDNKVNIMVMRDEAKAFFAKLPSLNEEIKKTFADYALEHAMLVAKNYPSQMRDLVVARYVGSFVNSTVALMVMDILYENGTFRPLTEREKVTSNLLMFCDQLPQ
ncbi:MAG: alanine:cation symporter family protein, partial [Clostridia bacterium]|nr:alanine:cation symporter family protein [Clostridia bacterium]